MVIEHITPVLHELYWLPVSTGIVLQILLLTYKVLQGLTPSCLNQLLPTTQPEERCDNPQMAFFLLCHEPN